MAVYKRYHHLFLNELKVVTFKITHANTDCMLIFVLNNNNNKEVI